MPKYNSVDGRWEPISNSAKRECEALGVTHLGGGKPKVDVLDPTQLDVGGKELSKKQKRMKERIDSKRGVISKKKKRKVF